MATGPPRWRKTTTGESADSQQGGHNHDDDSPAILAEVHLGNLEVYP